MTIRNAYLAFIDNKRKNIFLFFLQKKYSKRDITNIQNLKNVRLRKMLHKRSKEHAIR